MVDKSIVDEMSALYQKVASLEEENNELITRCLTLENIKEDNKKFQCFTEQSNLTARQNSKLPHDRKTCTVKSHYEHSGNFQLTSNVEVVTMPPRPHEVETFLQSLSARRNCLTQGGIKPEPASNHKNSIRFPSSKNYCAFWNIHNDREYEQ